MKLSFKTNQMWVQLFLYFFNMVKNQFGISIKQFQSDNARDHFNHFLSLFFQIEGIIYESSVNTP
uniref:Uncharacterized protein n=1 Tax=Rhizophora mucronata TaxID=61149 RepID=A0A2P2JF66_RHIMU